MSHSSMRTPLGRVRGLGSAKSGTGHFWLQRVTAVSNLVLTVIFIGIVIALSGRPYPAAMALLGNPLVAILMLLFILSACVHMRLGMQVIIEDYVQEEGPKILFVMLNTFFAIAVGAASVYAVLKLSFGG
ncbi:succinate dehydrogenase, hydrophobic membrane anchor protein [Bosea sp. (in: a-proteobacteria)]|uniref:succinate dehydrogenase, hydrophobic membrane anchor protein n=1 Tax=Bosea sp. (in: a-proteobacteria) TaxID=1871050 RepID=UPI003B3BA4D3